MFELGELLEDPRLILWTDTNPRVRDRERDEVAAVGHRGRHANLSALGELQRIRNQVAQDLRDLGLVGDERRDGDGIVEYQRDGLVEQQRPEHAAERAEQVLDLERRRPDNRLAGFDLGEVQQIVDELGQLLGRLPDVSHFRVRLASILLRVVDHQIGEPDDRVDRRPELVGHVREEPRLQFVGPAEMVRLLVELRIQRHDAAVRVLELAIEVHQLLLLGLQLVERAQELAVLMLQLLEDAGGPLLRERVDNLPGPIGGGPRQVVRQELVKKDRGTRGRGLDGEVVHQAARADDAKAHPGR